MKTKNERRFGFIAREGESKDLFFHEKDLVGVTFDELVDGENGTAVTFEVKQTEKGLNAVNVQKAA